MSMETMKKRIGLLSVLAGGVLLAAGIAGAAGGAGYVGSEKCKECHEEIVASHGNSLHAKAWAAKGTGGCESCHGGASEHVANPSKENIVSFGKESKSSVEAQSAQCQGCHASSVSLAMWDNGKHKANDVACSSCHAVHKSAKMTASEPETCFTCHKDIKSLANKFSHHPIIEGKVKCSDCHNPHGTLGHGMIKDENNNRLCYKCHADKRGPYVWEHPVVEEDCMKCHNPHGAKAAKLLNEKQPQLCQQCHDDNQHPGTPYGANSSFTGIVTGRSTSVGSGGLGTGCTACHGSIHGSNSAGTNGKYFVR